MHSGRKISCVTWMNKKPMLLLSTTPIHCQATLPIRRLYDDALDVRRKTSLPLPFTRPTRHGWEGLMLDERGILVSGLQPQVVAVVVLLSPWHGTSQFMDNLQIHLQASWKMANGPFGFYYGISNGLDGKLGQKKRGHFLVQSTPFCTFSAKNQAHESMSLLSLKNTYKVHLSWMWRRITSSRYMFSA